MSFLLSPLAENIILTTAIINIAGVLFIFLTCRFIPALKFAKPITKKSWFKSLYKTHSYVWWLLMPSILVHFVIAISHRLAGG
jgi:hypothetical protein